MSDPPDNPIPSPSPEAPGAEETADGLSAPAGMTGIVVRGVSLAGAGYVLTQAITMIAYLVLARLITPRDFGHFTAGVLIAGLGTLVGDAGMATAVVQRQRGGDEVPTTAFLSTVASGTVMTLLALAAAPLLGFFFHSHEVELIAAVMSGWLFLRMIASVPQALLQRRLSFLRRVIVDPLAAVAFLVAAVVAGALGMGAWALVLATYAGAFVTMIAGWLLAKWWPRPRLASLALWRELVRFARPVVIAEAIRRGVDELPVAGIGRFLGAGPLGQYTYAMRVASQPLGIVVETIAYVLLPSFARLAADERRLRGAVLRALRAVCAVAFPMGLILVPLGLPGMTVIFGRRWHEAGYALMALAVTCAVLSLDSLASEIWKGIGTVRFMPRMHGLAFVLTVLLIAASLPLGLVGVCGGISLASFAVACYAVWGIHAAVRIPLRTLLVEMWPPAVAAGTMAALLYALDRLLVHAGGHGTALGLLLLTGEALVGVALYLGLLAGIAPGAASDLAELVKPLLGRLRRLWGDTRWSVQFWGEDRR